MDWKILGCSLVLLIAISKVSADDHVEIETSLGKIFGLQKASRGEFLGIPFAKPPTGENRFLPPVPVQSYQDFKAFDFGPICVQTGYFLEKDRGKILGEEDCLSLNVYTPGKFDATEKKPVLVWIHGGGFTLGSAKEYDPEPLMRSQDILVVTINYRLGHLGFLTFGNSIVSGNMGLRDQIEALRWIQEHIEQFGGDPNKVTIFGESAGAASVQYLQLSPLAENLFSGVIAQSGTALLYRKDDEVSKNWRTANMIGEIFNCSCTDTYDQSLLRCLQNVPAEEFHKVTSVLGQSLDPSDPYYGAAAVAPVVDAYVADPVLPLKPMEALLMGKFNKVPLMTGTNKNEGSIVQFLLNAIKDHFDALYGTWSASMMQISASYNKSEITEFDRLKARVAHQYYYPGLDKVPDNRDDLDKLFQLFNDVTFLSPDQKVAELVSEHTEVFNYLLVHSSEITFAKFFGADPSFSPVHGDDIIYLFANSELAPNLETPEDKAVSAKMVQYWTNFAKYGKPTITDDDADLPAWSPYLHDKNYLELKPEPEMKKNIHPERMLFWQKLMWQDMEHEARLKNCGNTCPCKN